MAINFLPLQCGALQCHVKQNVTPKKKNIAASLSVLDQNYHNNVGNVKSNEKEHKMLLGLSFSF
jgi:hypothetical protein